MLTPRNIISSILFRIKWHLLGGKKRAEEFARQRAINQAHCYDFPSENIGWKKYGSTPVYGNESTSCVFDPFVFIQDGLFVMIVSERLTHGIDRLESSDGINWIKIGPMISRIPGTWQDLVNRSTLVQKEGVWHMWYTGQQNGRACIGHTISLDGLKFKNASNPCMVAEFKGEGVSVMNPCVLWNEKKRLFQMWYAAGENYEPDVIFYAESTDGDHWKKRQEPVLTKLESHEWEKAKVGGCDVKIKADGTYEMYYIGYQNVDVARICYATSKDGLDWNRSDNNLLIAPSKNRFDSDATYKPSVVERDGKQYMWYNGRHNHEEYIGLAYNVMNR